MRGRPLLGLVLASCATILGEETKDIRLVSDPPGAEVRMDGLYIGHAPMKVSILEQEPYDFTFRWDGGAVAHCGLSPSFRPLFLVADVFMGVGGIVTDAVTGLWSRQDADECSVRASQRGVP
jgi:PEGA domain-containing protein